LSTAQDLIKASGSASEELATMAEEASTSVEEVRGSLQGERRVLFSAFGLERSHTRPTGDQIWSIDQARDRLPDMIDQINEIIMTAVPALWDKMNEEGLRPDPGEPVTLPGWRR